MNRLPTIRLSKKDCEIFVNAISNPQHPNKELKEAYKLFLTNENNYAKIKAWKLKASKNLFLTNQ